MINVVLAVKALASVVHLPAKIRNSQSPGAMRCIEIQVCLWTTEPIHISFMSPQWRVWKKHFRMRLLAWFQEAHLIFITWKQDPFVDRENISEHAENHDTFSNWKSVLICNMFARNCTSCQVHRLHHQIKRGQFMLLPLWNSSEITKLACLGGHLCSQASCRLVT